MGLADVIIAESGADIVSQWRSTPGLVIGKAVLHPFEQPPERAPVGRVQVRGSGLFQRGPELLHLTAQPAALRGGLA